MESRDWEKNGARRFSRRGRVRGIAYWKMIVFLLLAICAIVAPLNLASCNAASSYTVDSAVHKITAVFGEEADTSRAFCWYTPRTIPRSDLQVVKMREGTYEFRDAVTITGQKGPAMNDPREYWHKAVVENLSPDTEYAYRVGDSKENRWGPVGNFTTAPAPETASAPFTFICLTDTQAGTKEEAAISAQTIAAALKLEPDAKFILHSGDIVDDGANETQWGLVLDGAQGGLLQTTLMPAAGNHEDGPAFAEHFNLPAAADSDVSNGVYYSVRYASACFINLNTNEDSEQYAAFSPKQAAWLEQEIGRQKAAGAKWIIVNMHKGPFTVGEHAMDGDIAGKNGLRAKVAPMLATLGADLVLQGHDHTLSRTNPLYNRHNPSGTIFMNLNTAGPKVYARNQKLSKSYLNNFAYLSDKKPDKGQYQNFALVTVDKSALKVLIYEINRKAQDNTPYIVDQFTIRR